MYSNVRLIQTFILKPADTKDALLNAAEKLFANHGFAATSMREIATTAKANLASANYHFGGKRGLMIAVLERRVTPLNCERLRLLDALEAESGRRVPPLDKVIEAFFGPALRMCGQKTKGGESFDRLIGRMFIEPDAQLHTQFVALFKEVADRFIPTIQKALPSLPAPDLFWRLHFMIGSMAHTMCDKERLRAISCGKVNPDDTEAAVRQLTAFVVGGLRAPKAQKRKGGKR